MLDVDWNYPPRVGRESAGNFRALLKTLRFDHHSLAVGAEVGYRRFDRGKQFFGSSPRQLGFEDADFHWLELASFLEDTVYWRDLSLSGGLRFEYFENPRRSSPTPTRRRTPARSGPQPGLARPTTGRWSAASARPLRSLRTPPCAPPTSAASATPTLLITPTGPRATPSNGARARAGSR